MTKRTLLSTLLLTLLLTPPGRAQEMAGFPSPQETSAEQMEKQNLAAGKPARLNGVQETMLPNGLTILTKEVHAAPVVYLSVWYKVGSIDEEVGQSGMSHLMEHMMFKGTKQRGPGVISASLQRIGAEFNASTAEDRTNYLETVAADQLPLAIQIESDRMVNSVYDETQHQREMTVVRSELERDDNSPGFLLTQAVRAAAYQIHPYRWDPIGYRADIEHFTRDEMYAYYKNYYAPNNAVVIVVGDFDTPKTLALMRQYFGAIPRNTHIAQHYITPEPPQQGERRITLRRAGTTPQIEIAYHVPGFGSGDQYALDVLETVMAGGRTGRFFQDIVQTGIASDAEAGDLGLRAPSLLLLDAVAQPGHTNADLERALLAEVANLQKTPISTEELTRAINQAEANYIFGKESVEEQGDQLGEGAMRGNWRYGETYLSNLRKVTPADVRRVALAYLTPDNRTVGDFEPIIPANGDAPPPSIGGGSTTSEASPPAPNTGGVGKDCLVPPVLGVRGLSAHGTSCAPPSKKPTPVRTVLPNGLTLIVQENHANPTVSVSGALLSAGGAFDPADKPGIANLTAGLLSRGTQTRSLLDIARTLEGNGISVQVGGGEEYVSLGGRSLSKDFGTLLDVLSDEMRHPAFPAGELDKARAQGLAGIEQARQDTGTLSGIAFSDALYPKGHPYHQPTLDEQAAMLRGITRDDLTRFYQSHYGPDKMVLTIVGDVTPADAAAAVQKYFGDWRSATPLPSVAIPATPPATGAAKAITIFVPDKTQVDVLLGYPGQLRRSDPDYYAVTILDTILGGGGGLSSRLALSVRDRLGLAYTIDAGTDASLGAGPFQVGFGTNPANVDRAVAESQRQLALLRDKGITPQELADAISYINGSFPLTLATNSGISRVLLFEQIYGLGLDYVQNRPKLYSAVTVEKANAAAKKYFQSDSGVLVIAGTYSGKYAKK